MPMCISTQYPANKNVPLLEWPALSPDLSPIKYIWDYLGQRISCGLQMNNLREPKNTLQQEWNAIPQNTTCRFIWLMRIYYMACVDEHGGHMRY